MHTNCTKLNTISCIQKIFQHETKYRQNVNKKNQQMKKTLQHKCIV